jgi:hypothetical protein
VAQIGSNTVTGSGGIIQSGPKKAVFDQIIGPITEEAATVFQDRLSVTVPDPDHSTEEGRWIIVGLSHRFRLLIVSHTERGDRIRIISARELTPGEREEYEEGNWS